MQCKVCSGFLPQAVLMPHINARDAQPVYYKHQFYLVRAHDIIYFHCHFNLKFQQSTLSGRSLSRFFSILQGIHADSGKIKKCEQKECSREKGIIRLITQTVFGAHLLQILIYMYIYIYIYIYILVYHICKSYTHTTDMIL